MARRSKLAVGAAVNALLGFVFADMGTVVSGGRAGRGSTTLSGASRVRQRRPAGGFGDRRPVPRSRVDGRRWGC